MWVGLDAPGYHEGTSFVLEHQHAAAQLDTMPSQDYMTLPRTQLELGPSIVRVNLLACSLRYSAANGESFFNAVRKTPRAS